MIEVIREYNCHDCGSNCDVAEVVYGKIIINLCSECIGKKEEQREFKFSELSDKAKGFAVFNYLMGEAEPSLFAEAWEFHKYNEHEWVFDEDGEVIDE